MIHTSRSLKQIIYTKSNLMQELESFYGGSAVNLGFHSNKRTTPYAAGSS